MTSTPTRPVDNVVITTKGLQDRHIIILAGTTVENKGKLILTKNVKILHLGSIEIFQLLGSVITSLPTDQKIMEIFYNRELLHGMYSKCFCMSKLFYLMLSLVKACTLC